jgi:hypothetical protein
MTGPRKLLLILLGVVSAFLMVGQLALGQLILSGAMGAREKLIKAHQHNGYAAIALALVYVLVSLWTVINTPTRPKG